MQSNIYAQKENGDLRLIAEIEGENDPALAVDALLDEMPRLKQRSFVVIDVDNVLTVEAGDEIVQPRREITVTSGNNVGGATVEADEEAEEDEEEAEDEEQEEPEAEEEEAPAPKKRRPGRPRGSKNKQPAKRPAKRSGSKKSPFRSNPASAE